MSCLSWTQEFSQDLESNEEIDAVDDTEETALDPITPSDYLVKNASDYVTIGDYSDVEVTKYTYEITDDMVQEEIQEELESYSEEESTNAPSEDGNIVYMNLTATVDGEAGDEEETFIILGQEEYGAEFDEKLTGVSAGDQLDFSVTYGVEYLARGLAGQNRGLQSRSNGCHQIQHARVQRRLRKEQHRLRHQGRLRSSRKGKPAAEL